MGINPTPTNHRSFTFDGKSTREFGVYTTGKDVFNSPERAVEMISIPGRDGEYALDQGHFNNIEVTYRAGIVADSTTDFAEAISNFRNWLASRKGYCRLTDEYNTEEYRMAVFKNAIALEHEGLLTGEFDITFNCKPQRWLTEGETPITIGEWGETETYSGEIVSFEATDSDAVKALTADIDPIQDLNGYDAPWVGGAGKNKLKPLVRTGTTSGISYSINADGSVTLNGTATTVAYVNIDWRDSILHPFDVTPYIGKTLYASMTPSLIDDGRGNFDVTVYTENGYRSCAGKADNGRTFTYEEGDLWGRSYIAILSGATFNNETFYPLVCLNSETNKSWTPYENICPISGHDEVTVTVADDVDNPTVSEDYTTTLPSTTYGGTLDVVSGELISDFQFFTCADVLTPRVNGRTTTAYFAKSNAADNLFYMELGWTSSAYLAYSADYDRRAETVSNAYKYNEVDIAQLQAGEFVIRKVTTQDASGRNLCDIYIKHPTANTVSDLIADLTSNNVQFAYPLATPQTYQLTPQQIALLLGENNIFADSGNVTVEVGQNPSFVVNPTLFDSKPLLAVEGYGEIKFNGNSIVDIESGQLGDITIANNMSASSIQIDESLFNIGDAVTVSGAYQDITINLRTDGTYYNIVRESESITDSNTDFSTTFLSDSPGTGQQTSTITYRITIPSFNITIGTDKTITDVVSGTISCKAKNPSANTFTVTFTTTREYKYEASTNTITWDAYYSTVSTTAAYVVDAWQGNLKTYFGSVVGHSTVSKLGNPTYIDCDIGEAYMIKDGQPISLNQYIDLGSDLPTLPTGATEVTFDNTVTELKVTPRWWKV